MLKHSAVSFAPLKTTSGKIITDHTKQKERWAEHYQELYTETAVENTNPLPVMEELDDPPTTEELGKAIDSLASGKAPGNDGSQTFTRVVLNRLQLLAERVYPEAQCGFRAERSTIDMIFSLRQLQEKCREQRHPLYIAFIDLTKAFDLDSRAGLFTLLQRIGCPPKLLRMITSFHEDMKGIVQEQC